jgi:ankyrin repeat protein
VDTMLAEAIRLAGRGFWDELGVLLGQRPDLATLEDDDGRTLLMRCAGLGGSAMALRKLVALGADPNHRAQDNSTALAAAITGGSRHGPTTLPELATLLDLGADPEAVADGGMPALHWAIAQHRPEHVELLLDYGARLDTLTSNRPPESAEDIARRVESTASLRLLDEYRRRRETEGKT